MIEDMVARKLTHTLNVFISKVVREDPRYLLI